MMRCAYATPVGVSPPCTLSVSTRVWMLSGEGAVVASHLPRPHWGFGALSSLRGVGSGAGGGAPQERSWIPREFKDGQESGPRGPAAGEEGRGPRHSLRESLVGPGNRSVPEDLSAPPVHDGRRGGT